MRISERISGRLAKASGRPAKASGRAFAWAVMAGLGLALLPAGAAPAWAQEGMEPDLGLLRQFHSYAPARQPLARPRARNAATRATLMRKARAAWRKGDYALARKLFGQAFKAGEVSAGWYLGYLYRSGRGGKVDHGKAFTYYRALALRYDADERNLRRLMMSVDALVRVADYYRTGIGRKHEKRDLRRAFRLYSMAAAHNHAGAYYGMALVALKSNGRIARKRWAIGWLKRAAMSGHAPAARKLAWLAANGLPGVLKPDPVAARAWRIIAMRLRGPAIFDPGAGRLPALKVALTPAQEQQARTLADQFLVNLKRLRAGRAPVAAATPAAPATSSAASPTEASVVAPAPRR